MRMIVVWLPYWKRFRMPAWVFLVYWIGLQLLSFAVGDGPGWIREQACWSRSCPPEAARWRVRRASLGSSA
jgi:hypothetical protein